MATRKPTLTPDEDTYHPLFPPDEGQPPPDVRWVLVRRLAPREAVAPRRWEPEACTLEAIHAAYGGGSYELKAYGPKGIVARARYTLEGRPRSMAEELDDAADDYDDAPLPPQAYAPPPPPPPAGGDAAMMLGMFQTMAQMMMASAAQQTQMVVALLQSSSAGAREQVTTMQQIHAQHSADQARLSATIVEALAKRGGSSEGGAVDALLKGLELGREMHGGEDELERLVDAAGPLIEGFANAQNAAAEEPKAAAE